MIRRQSIYDSLTDPRARDKHRRVLSVLSLFADSTNGKCMPSLGTIEALTGIGVKKLSQITRELADMGFLSIERRGRRLNNIYTVHMIAGSKVTPPVGGTHKGGDSPFLGPVTPPVGGTLSINNNLSTIISSDSGKNGQKRITTEDQTPPKKLSKEELKAAAERVYDHYASKVRAGRRDRALGCIQKRLKSDTEESLKSYTDNYSNNGMSPDQTYRIQPHNFFSDLGAWKEYRNPAGPPGGRSTPTRPSQKLLPDGPE